MTEENRGSTAPPTTSQKTPRASSERKTEEQTRDNATKEAVDRDRTPEPKEDPEEWADPICVCEAEPYWQEVAEQLERERGGS